MMEASKSIKKIDDKPALHKQEGFKGYGIEQLKYQRALLALQKEFAKEKLLRDASDIRKSLPFSGSKKKKNAKGGAKNIM